jgi:16S rRNA (cytidine1402-2'-O)-methyltransferase
MTFVTKAAPSVVRLVAPSFRLLAGGMFGTTRPLLNTSKRGRYQEKTGVPTTADAKNPLAKPISMDPGALHVVSVPIGNLKDFSLRALEVLKQVDYIVCIDRETTKVLLDLVDLNCSGRLIHYREDRGNEQLVTMLKEGRSMALVAPSGTPCVGDKGTSLVKEMLREGIRVTSVPGPSSIIAALSISGLAAPSGCFFFGGYLPEKQSARLQMIRSIAPLTHPSVFFELPRSLLAALHDIAAFLPRRRVALVHEVTKLHESLHCDVAERLTTFYSMSDASILLKKGQLVMIIEGDLPSQRTDHVGVEKNAAAIHKMVKDYRESSSTDSEKLFLPSELHNDAELAMRVVSNLTSIPMREVQTAYEHTEAKLERQKLRESARLQQSKQSVEHGEQGVVVSDAVASSTEKRSRRKRIRRRLALIESINRKQEAIRLQLLAQRAKSRE